MSEEVTLHGYRYSVYNRIALIALHLKQITFETIEVDPFDDLDPAYLNLHPFAKVPVLTHAGFSIYETQAITRYINRAFPGLALEPDDAKCLARMDQVIGIIDSYAYWPMVRQVFSQRVFQPLTGEKPDEHEIQIGLETSTRVLAALESIARQQLVLDGKTITLADCHLAPMMDYFTRAGEGQEAVQKYPALLSWWQQLSNLPAFKNTDQNLSELGA